MKRTILITFAPVFVINIIWWLLNGLFGFYALIVFACFCGLLIAGFGFYTFKSKKPISIYFNGAEKLKPDDITDIRLFNRDNGKLYMCCGLLLTLIMALGLWIDTPYYIIAPFLFLAFILITLPFVSLRIMDKYKVKK